MENTLADYHAIDIALDPFSVRWWSDDLRSTVDGRAGDHVLRQDVRWPAFAELSILPSASRKLSPANWMSMCIWPSNWLVTCPGSLLSRANLRQQNGRRTAMRRATLCGESHPATDGNFGGTLFVAKARESLGGSDYVPSSNAYLTNTFGSNLISPQVRRFAGFDREHP